MYALKISSQQPSLPATIQHSQFIIKKYLFDASTSKHVIIIFFLAERRHSFSPGHFKFWKIHHYPNHAGRPTPKKPHQGQDSLQQQGTQARGSSHVVGDWWIEVDTY
jgi:hypothetical protein